MGGHGYDSSLRNYSAAPVLFFSCIVRNTSFIVQRLIMGSELESHRHKVHFSIDLPAPFNFTVHFWLIIEDERDEYIASSVKAYCPKKEKSLEALKRELFSAVADLVVNKPKLAKLLKKAGGSEDKLVEFTDLLTDALFDETQLDSNVVRLQKSIRCIKA